MGIGAVILAAVIAAGVLAAPAGAQQAAIQQHFSPVMDEQLCDLQPRTIEQVVSVIGTPGADATPLATPVAVQEPSGPGVPLEVTLPEGKPASILVVNDVSRDMRRFTACFNLGDVPRMMNLVSDQYLSWSFGIGGLTRERAQEYIATPAPIPVEEQRDVVDVRDARVLDDGRIGALFDLAARGGPVPGEIRTDFVIFREQGDRWVIDAYAANLPPDEFGPFAESDDRP